jgi:hypothetical protein
MKKKKKKLSMAFGPQANYTGRVASADGEVNAIFCW